MNGDAITAVNSDIQAPNIYAYCLNNPVLSDDKTGYYSGVDDFVALGIGAAAGVLSQFAEDVVDGNFTMEEYFGSAVGGAVGGWVTIYYPMAGGAVEGGLSHLISQSLLLASGKSEDYYYIEDILIDSILEAGCGLVFDLIPIDTKYSKAYESGLSELGDFFTRQVSKNAIRDTVYNGSVVNTYEFLRSLIDNAVRYYIEQNL